MYTRNFIILNKEDENYCGNGATGYCKIEIKNEKCKIKVYAQGLKPLRIGSGYKVHLLCYDNNSVLSAYLGDIAPYRNQNELDVEVNTNNVLNTNYPISKYNIIVICTNHENDDSLFEFPLVGYHNITKNIKWKSLFIDHLQKNSNPSNINRTIIDDKQLNNFENEEEFKVKKDSNIYTESDTLIEETDYAKYLKQGSFKKVSQIISNIKGIRENNPFVEVKLKYKWWEISDLKFFDSIFKYSIASNQIFKHPLIKKMLKDEPRCLFGIVSDMSDRIMYIAYGFPAKYSMKDQIYVGGFANFYPSKGSGKTNGAYGYWVVHIRIDNDNIIMTV